ncbi:MAG TPA: DUF4271 domain-containing protein [Bacteroidia bacterium]
MQIVVSLHIRMPITNDSLLHKPDSAFLHAQSYPHIFEGHQLVPKSTSVELLGKEELVWPAFVFIIGFILLVLIRTTSAKRFFMILKAIFTLGASKQLMREDYKLNKGSAVLFSIVFVLHFSFFLFEVNSYYGYFHYPFNSFLFYLLIIGCVLTAYALKIIVSKLFSSLLLAKTETDEYIFNIFLSTNAIGLFLFPVIVCSEYSQLPVHYFLISGIALLLIFYTIRVFKGIAVAYVSGRFSIFHLFLYFCALELLPLIVVIKLLVSRIL